MQLDNLRNVRRDRALTQEALGRRIGVGQARISSIEWGTNVSRDTAERLADALLCDVADLTQPKEPTLTFKLSDLSPEVLALLK
jgi:transcriptional regulator with XRE-family HTH domain